MGTKPHCGILLTSFDPWTKGIVESYPGSFEPLCRVTYRHFEECQKFHSAVQSENEIEAIKLKSLKSHI